MGRRSVMPAVATSVVTGSEGPLSALALAGDEEGVDGHLGLGELAQLTVNNEAEASYDVNEANSLTFFYMAPLYNCSLTSLLIIFTFVNRFRSIRNRSARRGMQSIRCVVTLTACVHWPSIQSNPSS